MASLPHLPPEILCSILAQVDPPDLAIIPRVCRVLYNVVAKNTSLFKQVYLRVLDEPPPDVQPVVDWEQAIKDLVRLQVVCRRASIVDKVCGALLGSMYLEELRRRRSAYLCSNPFRKTSFRSSTTRSHPCLEMQGKGAEGQVRGTRMNHPAMPGCWWAFSTIVEIKRHFYAGRSSMSEPEACPTPPASRHHRGPTTRRALTSTAYTACPSYSPIPSGCATPGRVG